jgi:hypothetical protein
METSILVLGKMTCNMELAFTLMLRKNGRSKESGRMVRGLNGLANQ